MTARPAPDFGHSVASVFRFQSRRIVRGRKLRLGVVALVLVVGSIAAAHHASSSSDVGSVLDNALGYGFFQLLGFLFPILLSAGGIAEEVESRTFTYLTSRSAGRHAITLGKYLAGATITLALLIAGALVLHAALYVTSPDLLVDELPDTLRAIGALTLLSLCYAAISMFWGSLAPEAAGILAGLYLLVVEFGFGFLPAVMPFVSMNFLARRVAGLPDIGPFATSVPVTETGPLAVALIVVTAFFLGLTMVVVKTSEYRFARA